MTATRLAIVFLLLWLPVGHAAEPAMKPPAEVEIAGIPFALIPEGLFTITVHTGVARHELKQGQRFYRNVEVWLDSFYIGKWEAKAVTLARFLNSPEGKPWRDTYQQGWKRPGDEGDAPMAGCTLRRTVNGKFEITGNADLPATDLSWELANRLSTWLGFRLPTEAEWQKAARGADQRIWPWGDVYPDDTYANFGMGRGCHPSPVDNYPKGKSPYGVLQMAGNMSEYVEDWYNEHSDAQLSAGTKNPLPPKEGTPLPYEEPHRINKGGDWGGGPTFMAIGFRNYRHPAGSQNRSGVRFAIDTARVIDLITLGTATIPDRMKNPAEK